MLLILEEEVSSIPLDPRLEEFLKEINSFNIFSNMHISGSYRWIIDADRPAYLAWKRFTKQSAACTCRFWGYCIFPQHG